MPIILVKDIRTVQGGSQPHLMQADDGNFYVVKFQDNPQGTHVLANEMLAAKLAEGLRLPVASAAVVALPPELSAGLSFETPRGRRPIRPGLHFGSRLVITSVEGRSYDFLPQCFQHLVRNPEDLVGIQLFDLWTCNRDNREVICWKYSREKKYTVTFIDSGHCFGGPEWKFAPLIFPNGASTETSSESSEAWLSWVERIADFPIGRFESIVAGFIPSEWRGEDKQFSVIFTNLKVRQLTIAAELRRILSSTKFCRSNTANCQTGPRECPKKIPGCVAMTQRNPKRLDVM